MAKIYRDMVVEADPEKCFAFIADPEKAPIFVSSLHSVTPTSTEPKGVGNTWDWEYDMFGVPIKGSSECIEYAKPHKYVWKSTQGAQTTWTYTFTSVNGGTKISLTVEYDVPESVLGGIIKDKLMVEKLNEHEADNAFANLKAILET